MPSITFKCAGPFAQKHAIRLNEEESLSPPRERIHQSQAGLGKKKWQKSVIEFVPGRRIPLQTPPSERRD